MYYYVVIYMNYTISVSLDLCHERLLALMGDWTQQTQLRSRKNASTHFVPASNYGIVINLVFLTNFSITSPRSLSAFDLFLFCVVAD
jgi:hypothetical protein